ncbi:MAG: hypothetical protein CSA26_07040 [Desulfobacterales bacterium]|nr:MAG: hypothetical protein CSA26_07040 [Desulfobacterales bacterium]
MKRENGSLTGWLFFAFFTAILISGCSTFNETKLEPYLGRDVDLISYGYTIADELILESFPPLTPRQPDLPVLTTTFVDNNDLSKTSPFGRLLQEQISSRLVQQGYTVKELKMADKLTVRKGSGETILSRNIKKIPTNQKAQAILVGTMSHAQRTLYISARLIHPVSHAVISAKNYRLYMDQNVLAMFNLKRTEANSMIKEPAEPLINTILY